jgi:hypothetical protein
LERAGRVLDLVAEEKEKDEADDIGDVICVCVGKEVQAFELGAFRLRSSAAVPFETRNSSHIDAILSTPNYKKEPIFFTNWHPHIYTVLRLPLMMAVSYALTDFCNSFSAYMCLGCHLM